MGDGVGTLKRVDARELDADYRAVLSPGEVVGTRAGTVHLPRYFYEVPSWEAALETRLSTYFGAFEFLDVDVREAEPLRGFPRYLPCAVTAFAAVLDRFRVAVGGPVRIAANGGYRSPAHALSVPQSPHLWGAAADVYKVGGEYMDDPDRIRRYAEVARESVPGLWVKPVGDGPGLAFDHLHLDLGYLTLTPRFTRMEGQKS
ncbi:MAG TPA: hypothetical protein VK966_11495 [Longimicrobiales bacterium]|nr:hypothetical protein [Longimicrobiales bacterium]